MAATPNATFGRHRTAAANLFQSFKVSVGLLPCAKRLFIACSCYFTARTPRRQTNPAKIAPQATNAPVAGSGTTVNTTALFAPVP
jgi:hypothetical protein